MRGPGFLVKHITNARILAFGYSGERVSNDDWERLYSSGSWKRLETAAEAGRYSIIVGYCEVLQKKSILDVACGHGVLAERLKRLNYEKYLGIDVSAVAINEASTGHPDDRNRYLVAQAEEFSTDEHFDVIIFNECINYFDDPIAVVTRYLPFLNPSGHVLVSMYDTVRSRAAWKLLERAMSPADSFNIAHMSSLSWTVKLMVPLLAENNDAKHE